MAIVILGKTRCPLCEKVLEPGQEVVGFPPIFANRREAISVLSDAAVHRACLMESRFADRAMSALADERAHRATPRVCAICGLRIVRPEQLFAIGPMTQYGEPLARYDWFQAHRACLKDWPAVRELAATLERVSNSDEWDGPVLLGLVDQINVALQA